MAKRLIVETTGDIWAIPNLKELMPQEIAALEYTLVDKNF